MAAGAMADCGPAGRGRGRRGIRRSWHAALEPISRAEIRCRVPRRIPMHLTPPTRLLLVPALAAIATLAAAAGGRAPDPRRHHRVRRCPRDRRRRHAPIENATIVVTGGRIAQVGPAGKVTVPAGAARVSVTGKTVMPTIVDTHVHLSTTRDPLVADLRRRAYFGVSAAMSLGLDPPGDPFQVRASPAGGRSPLLHRRTRHHHARAGPDRRALLGDAPRPTPVRRCRSRRR